MPQENIAIEGIDLDEVEQQIKENNKKTTKNVAFMAALLACTIVIGAVVGKAIEDNLSQTKPKIRNTNNV